MRADGGDATDLEVLVRDGEGRAGVLHQVLSCIRVEYGRELAGFSSNKPPHLHKPVHTCLCVEMLEKEKMGRPLASTAKATMAEAG